jgi:hypothetical protein
MFQPFSVSENTIRYTARSGIVPWILVAYPPEFRRLCRLYREVAAENGRTLRLGESVGAFRAVHFGRTEEEAVALFRDTNYAGFSTIISAASASPRRSAFPRTPRNIRRRPCCRSPSGRSNGSAGRNTGRRHRRPSEKRYRALKVLGGERDLEWFGWFFDQGFMPWDEEMRQIEQLAEHIIPAFR